MVPKHAQNSTGSAPGRPFRRGRSGNPGGRPAGIRAAIKARYGDDGGRLIDGLGVLAFGTAAERKAFFREAVTVSTRDRREAITELLDRGFGKATQSIEHSGASRLPTFVRIVRQPARPLVEPQSAPAGQTPTAAISDAPIEPSRPGVFEVPRRQPSRPGRI